MVDDSVARELGAISAKLANIEVHLANQLVQFEKIWDKFDAHDVRLREAAPRTDCASHNNDLDKVWKVISRHEKDIHNGAVRGAVISGGILVIAFAIPLVAKLFL